MLRVLAARRWGCREHTVGGLVTQIRFLTSGKCGSSVALARLKGPGTVRFGEVELWRSFLDRLDVVLRVLAAIVLCVVVSVSL